MLQKTNNFATRLINAARFLRFASCSSAPPRGAPANSDSRCIEGGDARKSVGIDFNA
jgi:hypothetical protein